MEERKEIEIAQEKYDSIKEIKLENEAKHEEDFTEAMIPVNDSMK